METTDPYSHQGVEAQSSEAGSKLNISPAQSAQIEPQDAHWLRMDPSLTRSVLAKTEEELLGSLAALMRNKVEHEQVSRRLAQTQIDTEQARHELGAIKEQIRQAEEEVATRLNEQTRINEEIVRVRDELAVLHEERQGLQQAIAEQETFLGDLLARKQTLAQEVAEATDQQSALQGDVASLEARFRELADASEKVEQARIAEGLPLLFGQEPHHIAAEWDPYPLESEFHTDEALDAKMVAKLVSMLPGLEGCLIVKNQGPVLASQLPERIHGLLKVPDRNYHLLFERLDNKVEEYNLQHARLATFDLGAEALTVAQSDQAFVLVNHRQAKLRPGMPDKLASIVSELAKMYP